MMKTPANALRPAPEGELPPNLLLANEDALLNEPVYKVIAQPMNSLQKIGFFMLVTGI